MALAYSLLFSLCKVNCIVSSFISCMQSLNFSLKKRDRGHCTPWLLWYTQTAFDLLKLTACVQSVFMICKCLGLSAVMLFSFVINFVKLLTWFRVYRSLFLCLQASLDFFSWGLPSHCYKWPVIYAVLWHMGSISHRVLSIVEYILWRLNVLSWILAVYSICPWISRLICCFLLCRNHRGLRHYWGLRVRGQHTKTTGRRGKTVGVSKKRWRICYGCLGGCHVALFILLLKIPSSLASSVDWSFGGLMQNVQLSSIYSIWLLC